MLALSALFGLTHEQYVTLLPKSITTAIGMGVSEELGGIVTLTVASIVVTDILGSILAEGLCRWMYITHPIAKALEMGEVEGAMSGLAIAVAGLITLVGASVFAQFL